MAHSFTDLLCHIVFATKHREPWLAETMRPELFAYLNGVLRKRSCCVLAVNGMEEHVHILARIHPSIAIADLLRDLKAGSSGWVHRKFPDLACFSWQTGYGAFSVSQADKPRVQAYIENQQEHHREMSFEDEVRELAQMHGLEYDDSLFWE